MPTNKKDKKAYQHAYYLKYRTEYKMECPICGHTVNNYPKHCETKLHKKRVEEHIKQS
jgi:hypothetical protein